MDAELYLGCMIEGTKGDYAVYDPEGEFIVDASSIPEARKLINAYDLGGERISQNLKAVSKGAMEGLLGVFEAQDRRPRGRR